MTITSIQTLNGSFTGHILHKTSQFVVLSTECEMRFDAVKKEEKHLFGISTIAASSIIGITYEVLDKKQD